MSTSLVEGQSTNRPPLFSGINFSYWKARMRIYIQTIVYHLWKVILKGSQILLVKVNSIDVPKLEEDWDDNDMRMEKLNAKAMNILYCALEVNEFNRISTCNLAKKTWDRLEVTHEGTSQVKESKISILIYKYKLFKKEPNESISGMYTRFIDIVNNLKNLGKSYTDFKLYRKVLRSLPRS